MSVETAHAPFQDRLQRVQTNALLVGAVALLVCLVLGLIAPKTFFPPYLVGFLFWFGIAVGSVGFLLLNNLVDGTWGRVIRRPLEAGAWMLVPIAVLFIPIVLGMGYLYEWATPEAANDPFIQHKVAWLNPTAFTLRAILYFAIWIALAMVTIRYQARQDRSSDNRPKEFLQAFSGPALLVLFLVASFAAIDWGMSLEPHWYSSLYGIMLIIGWGLATLASMILVTTRFAGDEPLPGSSAKNRWHDLGNLMLAFVMLWAYTTFSQFLIIYSGNLLEEIPWYLRRTRGGWQYFAIALLLFQFFTPFFLLLSRESKRRARSLATIAGLVLVMHLVDIAWLVLPAHESPLDPSIPWLQLLLVPVTVTAIGGFCVATFAWFLKDKDPIARTGAGTQVAIEHAGGA